MEDWQSDRMRWTRNPVYPLRGIGGLNPSSSAHIIYKPFCFRHSPSGKDSKSEIIMKKVFLTIFMFLPLMMSAQTVLTPEQKLEQAQKQLEEAKKAVEEAKAAAEKAKGTDKELEPSIANEPASTTINGKTIVVKNQQKNTESTNAPSETNQGWIVPKVEKRTEVAKKTVTKNGVTLKDDPKYLEGAIPTNENGKIEFTMQTDANGKSAKQIYDLVYNYFSNLTQDKNNIASRVALVNPKENIIANTMDEWLVFSQSFLSLDRTEFRYLLVAQIADNSLAVTLSKIIYNYEEGRSTGFKEPAENVISDRYALNKKKNGLARIFGKFRKGTIDRKDQIFSDIKALVKN